MFAMKAFIHPFQDGNGRTGRMILFRECLRHNLSPLIIEAAHRPEYLEALKEYRENGSIEPDVITMAKGMGNGFPVAGVLIRGSIKAEKGMLGTTFGGNHLACAAGIAVLDVIKDEQLVENADHVGGYLMERLKVLNGVIEVRGKGLMIGVDIDIPHSIFRRRLLANQHVITGNSGKNTLRLLPPLCVTRKEVDEFVARFKQVMN